MKAVTKRVNYTPRKLRLVANMIKGMKAEQALEYLKNVNKKGGYIVYKTLKSAIANAQMKGYSPDNLTVFDVRVDKSVILKRSVPLARFRTHLKLKRYSTLTIVLK